MQNVLPGNLETYPGREYWRGTSLRVSPLPLRRTRSSTWDDTVQTMQTLGIQRLSIPTFDDKNGDDSKQQKWAMQINPPVACTRGEPTELTWSMTSVGSNFEPSILRIEMWNLAWTVPTVIAMAAPNTGHYLWPRVYWGMPIKDEYFIKIYGSKEDGTYEVLGESPLFSIIK